MLLVGSPGTGKTLLARAIAGEAGVPFFSISGSDFVEMFVGVGASRVRDLFVQGKKNAPCIIFIDEIDAVGRHRGAGLGGGHDEREQTLNQLLVEMDGFESNEGVILIAATNRPDVLDPALLRPGRFDRQVVVPRPDIKGRQKILKVHARKVPLSPDADLEVVAKGTPGFSGADLANLINEAALLAARANKNQVEMADLEAAKDKVMMGAERRSLVITEKEKRVTAYHEAGHAMVALLIPEADPVHKVSIIPRGRAMGVTMYLPAEEKYSETKEGLNIAICTLLGGRIAEEMTFSTITSGASNDIERATLIARKMVCEWGMSDKTRPACLRRKGRGDFPRPRHGAYEKLQRSDRRRNRQRNPPHRPGKLSADKANCCSSSRDDLNTSCRGAAGAGDDGRGGDSETALRRKGRAASPGAAKRWRLPKVPASRKRLRPANKPDAAFFSRNMPAPGFLAGRSCRLSLDGPLIMGVLNVTPDSFSDGGRYLIPDAALRQGRRWWPRAPI